jgi:DNA-binding CsgD family transcriptional regulator
MRCETVAVGCHRLRIGHLGRVLGHNPAEVLVGRATELERLGRLLDGARLGHAGVLLLAGEAGLGKTSLLDAAVGLAGDFTVLRARGVESEGEIPHAVMAELLGGARITLEALPVRFRAALEAAQSLRPSVQGDSVVAAGWATLLALMSEARPVLVVVDDVQWVDEVSAESVLFAARRVHDARVATLLAVREPLAAAVRVDGVERLELTPLEDEDARLLAPGATAATIALAAGNPLALLELERHPSAIGAAGDAAELLFGARVDALTPAGRRALLAAALDTSGSAEAAAAVAGGSEHVDELRRHGLVVVDDGMLELRHPLLRSLMLARSWGAERRSVHASLANALAAGDERTRHRALAATEPDPGLAADLEALALRAGRRGGNAWLLERAADLTPAGEQRASRLLAAAREAFDVRDMVSARGLLLRARQEDAPEIRTGLAELDARLALADGARVEGARALSAVADEIAASEPERAVRLFVMASYVLATWGRADEALEIVQRANELACDEPVLDLLVASAHAEATAAAGAFVEAQRMFLALAQLGDMQPTVHADREARLVLVEAMWSGSQFDRARQLAAAAAGDARSDGALGELQLALACLFSIEFVTGRFDAADAAAAEELELAGGLGRAAERREALGHAAWCDALTGRADDCRRRVRERQELSESAGVNTTPHPALGLLELGLGNFEAAAVTLRASEAGYAPYGRSAAASPRPCTLDLVESLVRNGDAAGALETLNRFERDAKQLARPLALSLVHRGRGLLAADDSFDAEFETALRFDDPEISPFERARTQLCWGERLRRRRRRAEARAHLHDARDAFARSGAILWLSRAELELAATGERVRKRSAGSGGELTAQERRVAALVSDGLTNREVAARLFVSTNTVETHLRHLFQKLGVRSRTELVGQFMVLRDSNDAVAP